MSIIAKEGPSRSLCSSSRNACPGFAPPPPGALKMVFAAEYLIFILAATLVSTCTMDEEPVLDLTDLGAAHVLVFAAALLIVSADNLVKMSRGQYANSDRQVFSYAGFKSGALVFYFMLVSGLFFSHVTPPLLVDNVEAVTMWSGANALVVAAVLRPLAVLFALQGLLGIVLRSRAAVLNRAAFVLYLSTLLTSFWVQLWEFLGKTSTSAQERAANGLSTLSATSASPTTYAELGGDGGFD